MAQIPAFSRWPHKGAAFWIAVWLYAVACGRPTPNAPVASPRETQPTVRQPAVAGLFYPKDGVALSSAIDHYLSAAKKRPLGHVRALVCPHAGYEYSGPVAAQAYRQVVGGDFDTVIVLDPSHYAWFNGASVPTVTAYETPLGEVPISPKAEALARLSPFVSEPRCEVQRPTWYTMSSKPAPPKGQDTPDTWEHSVEVQVPFLQYTLKHFQLLPIIFGQVDPEQVAQALAPLLDERTLVVVSTDLSHYEQYETAQRLDQRTVQRIEALDVAALAAPEAKSCACGRLPLLTLLYLAKLESWTPHVLDYRNSGDTAGDKSRVVGYTAIAFTSGPKASAAKTPTKEPAPQDQFGTAERSFLLRLARSTLERVVTNASLPEIPETTVPAACREALGCFVTLTQAGRLRGCIGNILPDEPLYRAIQVNTRSAALHDLRFTPVTAREVAGLHLEISVLTAPESLVFTSPDDLLSQLQPDRDGVVLRIGNRGATYLPQVWTQLPDKEEFLGHLAVKAGCPADAWRGPGVHVSVYHAEVFGEPH